MQVIITCAGEGTRLKPLTDDTPKPLLPLNDKNILENILIYLKHFNVDNIYITSFTKQDQFKKWIRGCSYEFQNVTMFYLEELLGIPQQVKKIFDSGMIYDDNFCLIHGDLFLQNFNLERAFNAHRASGALSTIVVHRGKSNSIVKFDAVDFKIYDFEERPKKAEDSFVNSGIYFFNREIIDYISDSESFPKEVFPKLIDKEFYAYEFKGTRIAIDSIERLEQAKKLCS